MLFSSITFLYYFLPIVLILYFIAPEKFKNPVLFLASLVFYAWGEPKYVILMLTSIVLGYVAGICMEKFFKKPVMIVSVALSIGMLVYFKYTGFFLSNINRMFGVDFPLFEVIMPIGISFYTFQIISYILDVYYGKVKAQRNFLYLATYITMFPQLIAGPIVRYETMNNELEKREHSAAKIEEGIKRFAIGLAKKVLLANQFGQLCEIFRLSSDKSVAFYWLYALAATLQIYFDFSGYSDMAIGLGRIFGFSFPENFRYPYTSKSITEFWRRWHISLGTWFRDYVYIALGGNRKGKKRQILNIIIVWMLTGLWHGAEWNFVIWGIYFAILLILEKVWLYDKIKDKKVVGRVYTLFFVLISFVIFDAGNLMDVGTYLKNMFFLGNLPVVSDACVYYAKSYGLLLLLGIVGSTHLPQTLYGKVSQSTRMKNVLFLIEPVVVLGIMLLATAYLIDGSYNPFLYFRF